jgi:hypothetical protein
LSLLALLLRLLQGTIEEEAAAEDQGLLGRFIDYIQVRLGAELRLLIGVIPTSALVELVQCSLGL